MIILLYGPDSYHREASLRAHKSRVREKYPKAPFIELDEESEFLKEKLGAHLENAGLFSPVRILVLRNCLSLLKNEITFLKTVASHKDAHILIVENKKPLVAWKFLLEPPVKSEVFDLPEGAAWKKCIKKLAAERNLEIEEGAIQTLESLYKDDSERTWRLATDLDMYALLGRPLTKDILYSLGVSTAPLFWNLFMSFKSGSPEALERLLLEREPAAKIFNMLASQVAPNKKPLLAAADLAIKTGKLDYEEALLDFVLTK